MNKIKKYELSLAVLKYLSEQNKDRYVLRSNLIGFSGERGSVEGSLSRDFSDDEKALLDIILRELQDKGLIRPAFRDILSPGNDLIISDKGRVALLRRSLDELDETLLSIDSSESLIQKRYGAYDASLLRHTDWQRHVATSLVELIDQTLKIITPKINTNKIDKSKKGSIRKARISNFIMSKNKIRSESTEEVVDKAFGLVESVRVRLEAIKHKEPQTEDEAELLIKLTEDALCYLLNK